MIESTRMTETACPPRKSRSTLWVQSILWSLFAAMLWCFVGGGVTLGFTKLRYYFEGRPWRMEESVAAYLHAIVVIGSPCFYLALIYNTGLPKELRLRLAFNIDRLRLKRHGSVAEVHPAVSMEKLIEALRTIVPALVPTSVPSATEAAGKFTLDSRVFMKLYLECVQLPNGQVELAVTTPTTLMRFFTPVLAKPAGILAAVLVVLEKLGLIRDAYEYPHGAVRFAADVGREMSDGISRAVTAGSAYRERALRE